MKRFEYNLVSNTIWGSFDHGEVNAKDEAQALLLARNKIAKQIDKANRLLENSDISLDVDLSEVEVKEIPMAFDFQKEMRILLSEFDGQEFNGNAFSYGMEIKLQLNDKLVILCAPFFEGDDAIQLDLIELDKGLLGSKSFDCKKPTNAEEFAKFKQFYTYLLVTAVSNFATIDSVLVNHEAKHYTVKGFLVPEQVISFSEYSEWGSIGGENGLPIFDCQIDLDEELQFQYVDLNLNEEGDFNLDDTPKPNGEFITRDYRSCEAKLESDVHEFTARILDQFYIKYGTYNSDGDDQTKIMLDEMVRGYLK
jgi:hypothetical protein